MVSDLRMGSAPAYLFRFAIARREGDRLIAMAPEQRPSLAGLSAAAGWLWQRLHTPGTAMPRSDEVLSASSSPER